jgi:RHS repeat-associated protein
MAENLSYNPYRDMHNDVQLSAMFFGKNIQNIPVFNPTQTIEVKRLYCSLGRFTFTGKERDSETGFSYFGARYYDSDILTSWLSVDPMADKYPNISPYAYCAWNPVRLVDPDGEDPDIFLFPLEDKSYSVFYKGSKFIKQRDNAFQIMAHGNSSCMREVRNGKNVPESEGEINSAQKFDNVFRNNSKWNLGKHKKGFSVVLFSCNTGKGNNSLAMNLSLEYQNITVIAPSRQIWFSEKGFIGIYGKTESKKRNEADPGYWLVFQNGKVVAAYDSTWIPGESTKGHDVEISTIPKGHIDGVSIGEKEIKKGDKEI